MDLSRRTLLGRIAAGAVVSAASISRPLTAASSRSSDAGVRAPRPVRLHLGENAHGPSAKAVTALSHSGSQLNRYPDASVQKLGLTLATLHKVAPEQVVLGCGSTELLHMSAGAFCKPGRQVILPDPPFALMAECARRRGAGVIPVALRSNYAHDLDGMLSRADASTSLVYLCNPHNPTGSLTRRDDIERFIAALPANAYVLIDEAYHDYVGGSSDYASFIDRPVDDPRVIVVRTFSTIHGLAGLRIGYAVTSKETAALLAASRLPGGVNTPAATAAIAALTDTEHVHTSARRNANDRQEFYNQANARMLRTIDSHTNFVMLNTGRPAAQMIEHFRKHDVLVGGPFRSFDNYIRVSIGTSAEMREFWRVWDLLPPMHHMAM
jgi:histidinol-phosphate aminotransferase